MSKMTMGELCVYYLAELAPKKKGFEDEKCLINKHIMPFLAKKLVENIKYIDVQKMHDDLRDKPYMANRMLSLLSILFVLAEKFELRPQGTSPTALVKRYKEKSRRRYLDEEETRTFITHVTVGIAKPDPQFGILVMLLFHTGARISELLGAKWSDLKGQRLEIEGKTGKRNIYLNAYAMELLRGLKQFSNTLVPVPTLFNSTLETRYRWARLCKAADIEDFRIHDLRHNFASTGISAGLSLPQIGELLGHSSPSTTARYAHLCTDKALESCEKIGQLLIPVPV